MTKEEFLILFELDKIYNQNKNNIPFSLGYHDIITNTQNRIHFLFSSNENFKIVLYTTEFENKPLKLEINLVVLNNKINLNNKENIVNDVFPFLTFNTDIEASLRFLAGFTYKILIPKYELKGNTLSY